MSGALAATIRSRGSTGTLDTTAFSVDDATPGGSSAYCIFKPDGSAELFGSGGASPASPRWWTSSSPPATWMSYSSTGAGTVVGGLVAGTRYELNVDRTLGVSGVATPSRTFTISYYDAAVGGNLLGTKTLTASADGTTESGGL